MADHMAILDRELTDIATGKHDRLIVQMPPRHGKTKLTSDYFPAWYLGRWPHKHIIQIGADEDLARRSSMQARNLLEEHGPTYFGTRLDPKSKSAGQWNTEVGGGLKASGVGGTIVGFGADVLIVDDYIRGIEGALSDAQRSKQYQWYLSTASTRLSPTGSIVVVATRWHPQDLIGCLLRDAEFSGENWRVVSFPAIDEHGAALWPERWPIEKLERIKAGYNAGGYPWQWEALYQQNPPDILDSEWPSHYFGDHIWYKNHEMPARKDQLARVVALDPSVAKEDKSDYSAFVCVTKDRDFNYWVDADLDRRPSTEIVKAGMELLERWQAYSFGCETNQFQALLKGEFDRALMLSNSPVRTYGIHNHEHKMVRIRRLTPLLAEGRIRFRKGSPGVNLLLEQLKGWPNHKYDDGCFEAGTMIETSEGPKAIENVNPGDFVLTRRGYCRVLKSGCTGVRDTVTLRTSSGKTLTGTAEHPIFNGIAFVPMYKATRVSTCHANTEQRSQMLLSSMASYSGGTRKQNSGHTGCTIHHMPGIDEPVSARSTKRYGSQSTDQSQRIVRSITSTETNSTTKSRTWSASQKRSMIGGTWTPDESGVCLLPGRHSSTPLEHLLQSGMAVKPGRLGTGSTANDRGRVDRRSRSLAINVEKPTRHSPHIGRSSALQGADSDLMLPTVAMSSETVCDVKKSSTQPVYNLTIEGNPEYFANGILAHNCDALEMAIRMIDDLLSGIPQAVSERMGIEERAVL